MVLTYSTLAKLKLWMAFQYSTAEGRANQSPLMITPDVAEEMATATMSFTVLTTNESEKCKISADMNSEEGECVQHFETDDWVSV